MHLTLFSSAVIHGRWDASYGISELIQLTNRPATPLTK